MRSKTYQDFDEFAISVHDVDCRMMLRNPTVRNWSIAAVNLDSIDIQVGQLSSGNIAQGQLRNDGLMLYVPLTGGVEYVANGQLVEQDVCVLMDPGCEFCISTKAAHDWGAIFIPTEYLSATGQQTNCVSQPHSPLCRVTQPNGILASQLRSHLHQLFRTATVTPEFESTLAAKQAAREFFDSVVGMMDGPARPASMQLGRPKLSREVVIKRSREFLEQRLPTAVRTRDLAAAAEVSERTLRSVFNEYYGIGPVQYLQLRHLHLVRRALKAACPEETKVSQILVEHGEWAFSRFATRYKRLFGELPSDTLRSRS